MSIQELITRLVPPNRSEAYAYEMGFNCGLYGPNEENCHFSIFSSPRNTRAWEDGKRAAERLKDTRREDRELNV